MADFQEQALLFTPPSLYHIILSMNYIKFLCQKNPKLHQNKTEELAVKLYSSAMCSKGSLDALYNIILYSRMPILGKVE